MVFGEGQRRYLESLNAYARQFVQSPAKPSVEAIYGIPPTIAIEQRTSRGGVKSTVATQTEIYHYLRLLYVKLGMETCPECGGKIGSSSTSQILKVILKDYWGQRIGLMAPLVQNRKGLYGDVAKWAFARGYTHLRVNGKFVSTDDFPELDRFQDHVIDLPVADLHVNENNIPQVERYLSMSLKYGDGAVEVLSPVADIENPNARIHVRRFSTSNSCQSCGLGFQELDPRLFSFNSKYGWCPKCRGVGIVNNLDLSIDEYETKVDDFNQEDPGTNKVCPTCQGCRLNKRASAVRFYNKTIYELTNLNAPQLIEYFQKLRLGDREELVAREIIEEILSRLKFLQSVGLSYLKLNRSANSLSGGESQRIRLASQIGSELKGVCYVLDEPSIGLHPRDNDILLDALQTLKRIGNTVVVVEHDSEMIASADHIIDLGPGAGENGGKVTASGTLDQIKKSPNSLTGKYMRSRRYGLNTKVKTKTLRGDFIQIRSASLNNLKDINVKIPLRGLTVVTGVSGSGKSTLVRQVLFRNIQKLLNTNYRNIRSSLVGCKKIDGLDFVNKIIEVDQAPIGKTSRSCPATYIGIWDSIRQLISSTSDARLKGYSASRFSFNKGEGACLACKGQGYQKVEMNFLPNARVLCPECNGMRFNAETLEIKYRGLSAGQILELTFDEAQTFFKSHIGIQNTLGLLQDVGLGYLRLGQPSHTLSGGEAQRIKLVSELSKTRGGNSNNETKLDKTAIYILDEPTVGLHMADVENLISVIKKIVEIGNTVIVVEHNIDIWMQADWIIDMGPEGGQEGGEVVTMGSLDFARRSKSTHTGRAIAKFLSNASG